ncbi:hypothetical protein ACFDR9_003020 [Janthinobacterium sp. CG_23.3]
MVSADSAVKMTLARYHTPKGRLIQAYGVTPDRVVAMAADAGEAAPAMPCLDRGGAGAAKSATSRSPRPAPARRRRRHAATDSYPMPKTALAMLIVLLHCGASGAPTSPFSIPQKMQGVWGNTPAACNGDVLADSSGYEIDAKVIRQMDENCRIVKVKRESAAALTADFSCSWSDAPFPKTLALSLSADDSRLQVGDRRLVRCKSAK